MESREIVRRAIEFDSPPRLPFFLGGSWSDKLSAVVANFPNDVCDCWEMDRQENGWFFDNPEPDDWGCRWAKTEVENMGQVVGHPLAEWCALETYHPPDPRNPFYFARIEDEIKDAGDKYVVLTSHFNLFERLHMLHGFDRTLIDLYLEPEKIHKLLDIILEYKIAHINEAARRFGDRVQGLFLTDDWGTQNNTFISSVMFQEFFSARYKQLFDTIHSHGWHVMLHSCGKVNDFVPLFKKVGADVLNMQQPQAYGIKELGAAYAGKICFLTTVDIQATLPTQNPELVRAEARELVEHWSTPAGGFIVFNYGDSEAIGVTD
ncbi:MAG: uroporphyrinogen decarboxylase family protein, partial [Anaerolineae bacterium]|nr:uroporphyrinogen decarboxylase family protein [Anaerolineae bacterium]